MKAKPEPKFNWNELDRHAAVVNGTRPEGTITPMEYAERYHMGRRSALDKLDDLVAKGIMEKINVGHLRYFRLKSK